MLNDIKNTIKQSAVYGLSRISAKSLSFILLPLYTSIYSAQIIANINLLEAFWQYLFTICLFAFETAIITFCASEKDESIIKKTLFTFFFLLSTNCILFIIIGFNTSSVIAAIIFQDSSLDKVIFYCFLISAFESLLAIPLTVARLNNRPYLYSAISILNLVINLAIQIYFVGLVKAGFEYIFIAKFISPAILFAISIPYVIKNIKVSIPSKLIIEILKFSFPLMLASLLAMLLNTVDRYILIYFVPKDEVAIYTIGYSIGSLTNFFIVSPFVLAFNVMSWKKFEDLNGARFFTKSATYLYFAMILCSLAVALFMPYVIKIFVKNKQLWDSVDIIRIILFSNCIASLYFISIQSYYYKKRTDVIFYIFSICLTFNIATNLIFSKQFGIYSAALLSVISYILLLFLSYNIARKIYFIKFENYKITLLSVLYILIIALTIKIPIHNIYIDIIIKSCVILFFLLILYIFKFFEPIEIIMIKGFMNKYLFNKR